MIAWIYPFVCGAVVGAVLTIIAFGVLVWWADCCADREQKRKGSDDEG